MICAGIFLIAALWAVFVMRAAGSLLLVVDAFGNLTIVTPVVFPDGTVAAVIPAACQIAVVSAPVVPAA